MGSFEGGDELGEEIEESGVFGEVFEVFGCGEGGVDGCFGVEGGFGVGV